ncbi:MAG: HD-GYP domain-containing protein [Candidatus Scalinduaceae bacterium]
MNDYVAITHESLIENTKIGCDLYLQTNVNGSHRYVLFCRGDEIFCNERREVLIEKHIKRLFISTKDSKSFFRYQEDNLKDILADKDKSSQEKSQVVYQVAKYLVMDLMNDLRSGAKLKRVAKWVDNTIDFILHDENAFVCLLQVSSHDYYTYTHSVNLAVLGLLFGKHLSFDKHGLNSFGTGMLLHDVGKAEIPLEIINKPGKLTKDEREILEKHPENGLKLLQGKELEEKALIAVIQHHENFDCTGYPNKIGGKDIHLFGRISRIIDVYDAMTTNRPYADALRPFDALLEMKVKMLKCFEKELFNEFIYFLGSKDADGKQRKYEIPHT